MIGKKFGKLTITGIGRKRHGKDGRSWMCICDCGNTHTATNSRLKSGKTKSCGCLRGKNTPSGEDSPLWRGGRRRVNGGYIRLYRPDHPNSGRVGQIAEHRLVMEEILGRYLNPDEVVHHKNGIKDDNRPENLELYDKSHPTGQTISDKMAWIRKFLGRHPEEYRAIVAEYQSPPGRCLIIPSKPVS